ncbi:protein of unknown function [Shinella sp. WSC3-e]|nr:hypothetical protein SHINE37_40819 [Rhizobiaceae bacterium]CAK7255490.1 protein of unknown function [Shinella sp. WSC3-e]
MWKRRDCRRLPAKRKTESAFSLCEGLGNAGFGTAEARRTP